MAYMLRGELKGEEVELHQFANNWVTIKTDKWTKTTVYSPTSLVYTNAELVRMIKDKSIGDFWENYTYYLYDVDRQLYKLKKKR